jgi:hypothetical protein
MKGRRVIASLYIYTRIYTTPAHARRSKPSASQHSGSSSADAMASLSEWMDGFHGVGFIELETRKKDKKILTGLKSASLSALKRRRSL